jgi:DNA-binding NarL/FixJ family response regulator
VNLDGNEYGSGTGNAYANGNGNGYANGSGNGSGFASANANGHGTGDGHGRLRLLIVDRAATRVGIRMALDGTVEVCAEADDTEHAIRAAKQQQPDLALVSDHVAGDGLAAIRGICRAAPGCAVVVLASAHDADYLLECVRAGAVGYVPGPLDAERLRRVVSAAAANEAVVPRSMVLELVLELQGGGTGADGLTSRESQVLGMLRRGHKTGEIADRLSIAPVTVRRHISELVRKMGVENRAALTASLACSGARIRQGRVQ